MTVAGDARGRVGRNDPCRCRSGKKYKKCCGGPTPPVTRAVFAAPSVAPAVAFYRGLLPAKWLRARGGDAEIIDTQSASSLRLTAAAWHFHPFDTRELPLLQHMRRQRWPCFIGLDDHHWAEPAWMEHLGPVLGCDPRVAASLRERRLPITEQLLAMFDGVVVTTEPIAEAARRFNRNVTVIPNALPTFEDLPAPRKILDTHAVTIGWAGSPGHACDLEFLAPTLLRLLSMYKTLRVVLQGYVPTALRGHPQIEAPAWVPMDRYYSALAAQALDVMVAPLLEHPFNDARSELKFLDAGALGIPFVGSNVGPYKRTVEHGVTGLLVENTEDAWYDALRSLIKEPAMRRELGANGRRWVAEHGTIETTGPLWAKALGIEG